MPPKTDEVISGEEEKKENKNFNIPPRPQGERPPMGDRRPFPPRPQVKDHLWVTGDLFPPRPQGERPPMGDRRPFPPRPQVKDHYGDRRPFPPRPQVKDHLWAKADLSTETTG